MLNKIREEFGLSSIDDNNTACKVYDLITKTELRKSYEFVEEQRELLLDKVEKLEEELHQKKKILEEKEEYISHLKELCDRYEKEHNTTFKTWQEAIEILHKIQK